MTQFLHNSRNFPPGDSLWYAALTSHLEQHHGPRPSSRQLQTRGWATCAMCNKQSFVLISSLSFSTISKQAISVCKAAGRAWTGAEVQSRYWRHMRKRSVCHPALAAFRPIPCAHQILRRATKDESREGGCAIESRDILFAFT
jgi:hypothetical protein